MPGRIEKDVIIGRSGVYNYKANEVESMLGLSVNDAPKDIQARGFFTVYRPASVLALAVDKFVKLPLTVEHPLRGTVDGSNYKDESVGWTGDTAELEMLKDGQEVAIKSSVNLIDDSAVSYYDRGYKEVSPGYKAKFRWSIGKSPDGIDYQVVMDSIESVNHLALTQKGRGGPAVSILDSQGGLTLKTGLFRWLRKTFGNAQDSSAEFKDKLIELVKNRVEWTDNMISDAINQLQKLTEDLPASEDKETLTRMIGDFYSIKSVFKSDEDAIRAATMVAELYEKLDTDAMEEVDMLFKKKAVATDADPSMDKPKEGDQAPPAAEEKPAPVADETPAAAVEEPKTEQAPAAEPAPITLEGLPDNAAELSDEQLVFVITMLVKKLKEEMASQVTNPEVTATEQEEQTPVAAQDSVYRQPIATPIKGGSIEEFTKSLGSKGSK